VQQQQNRTLCPFLRHTRSGVPPRTIAIASNSMVTKLCARVSIGGGYIPQYWPNPEAQRRPSELHSAQLQTKTSSGCVWSLFLPSRVTVSPSQALANVANGRGEVLRNIFLYNECTEAEHGRASLAEHLLLNILTFVLSSKQTIKLSRWPTKFLPSSTQLTLQWLLLLRSIRHLHPSTLLVLLLRLQFSLSNLPSLARCLPRLPPTSLRP